MFHMLRMCELALDLRDNNSQKLGGASSLSTCETARAQKKKSICTKHDTKKSSNCRLPHNTMHFDRETGTPPPISRPLHHRST